MEDFSSALTVNDVVTRVRQRPVLAVAPAMLGLLLSVAYVVLTPPTYSASASVKVEPVLADRYAGNINVSNLISMQTEMQVAQSTQVAALAAGQLGLDQRTVRRAITVDSPQDTQVLNITYAGPSPASATRGAQIVATSYLSYRKSTAQAVAQAQYKQTLTNIAAVEKKIAVKATAVLETQLDALNATRRSQESILANNAGDIINQPVAPTSPAAPKPLLTIPAGIGLGALAGLALAVLWPARGRRRAVTAPMPPRGQQRTAQPQPRRGRDGVPAQAAGPAGRGGPAAARPVGAYAPGAGTNGSSVPPAATVAPSRPAGPDR
jgi:uncharacterized protein involved in exopolysaccharide biosynthesis